MADQRSIDAEKPQAGSLQQGQSQSQRIRPNPQPGDSSAGQQQGQQHRDEPAAKHQHGESRAPTIQQGDSNEPALFNEPDLKERGENGPSGFRDSNSH